LPAAEFAPFHGDSLIFSFLMVIGFRERDAQKSKENLHNKQVNCTPECAIPLVLATLSTTAAAINSSFDAISVIFGPPDQQIPL
jgi:hypothetical protein